MRFSLWSVALYALGLLSFLSQCATAVNRHYYIAAVKINWDYTTKGAQSVGPTYKKTVYREYDADFKKAKTTPWSGLLGPTLRGQVGDTIIVTFRNMADHPCSIHSHGIAYGKQSEGSLYFDNTSQFEKQDDVINPGKEHTYYWEVTKEVAPQDADPPCVTYTYFSHNDIVKDYNTGLIGTVLICKTGSLDESGNQVHFHQEFTLLFGVFDESNTWYSTGVAPLKEHVKYTINGFTNGSVPDLNVCAHSKVTWHLVGMSSEPELFSVHFNGQVLQQNGHMVSSIGIISGIATSAEMVATYPGRWLLSSHISKHLEAGLHGFLDINKCEEFTAPKRKLTIQQKRESQEWIYYIAAEEIIWDYAPNLPDNVDKNFRSTYLKQGEGRIGKKYKKAVFTQYTDESFNERAEQKQRKKELGILGPVIRAQIRDIIKIVFKNKASRPYSIYPHGLTIDKASEGVNYPDGGNQSHAVQPGETYTYVWRVIEEDEPLNSDSRCLTRMYHSAVNTPRDIASGLVGPLLICKSQSLNTRNVQVRADKEQHAMFAVFDENKSWYLNENILTYCGDPRNIKPDDPEFYNSNVMHTINGYVYESGQVLGFCNGEIATWHVSSVGEQDDIQTAAFYGHTFELNNREEDILSLFPMTGETISMNMANIGVWLMASLNTHETQKGLRVKFKDVECFRDYIVEDSDDDNDFVQEKYDVWKPINETEFKTEKSTLKQITSTEIDSGSDDYAEILGLRSLKNTGVNDMEPLDLSILDTNDDKLHSADVIQNMVDDNNLTTAVQNESTTESTIKLTLAPANSIINGSNGTNTNPSNISLLPNIDSEIISENSQNTLLVKEEIKQLLSTQTSSDKETQTPDLLLSSVEVVDEAGRSNDNIFIYSVPALNSQINITDVDMKDFVLLNHGEQIETNIHKHSVEHSISPTELPNNTIVELLDNSTQTTGLQDGQESNTKINSESLYERIQYLNNPKVVLDITQKTTQELNRTQVEYELSVQEDEALNVTKVEYELSVHEDKELNGTEMEDELLVQGDGELNGTKVKNTFSVKEDKELNFIKVEHEFSVDEDKELTGTEIENKLSVQEDEELNGTEIENKLSVQEYKKLNGTEIENKLSVQEDEELTGTEIENKLSVQEYKKLNGTEIENKLSVQKDKKLNGTEIENKLLVHEDEELNGTQVDAEFPFQEEKEINNTKLDSEILIEDVELNSTLLEFSVQEDMRHLGIEMTLEDLPHTDIQEPYSAKMDSKISNNTVNDSQAFSGSQNSEKKNFPQNVTSSSIVPFTNYEHNETKSLKGSNLYTSSEELSSESLANTSFSSSIFNLSSPESKASNTNILLTNSSSEQVVQDVENILNEVVIYLKDSNNTMVILTTPLDTQAKNWSYEGKHEFVPMEFPDHMNKYVTDKQPNSVEEEKKKIHLKRVTPMKGYGIKTRKRKEYKPQARSDISPRGFSPRGFAPSQLAPRTTKPNSEEGMMPKSIVIGIPRNDFNEYEIYVPDGQENTDFENPPDYKEEYDCVVYRDPYGKPAQAETEILDEVTKYSLQMAGSKSRVYFITAEEVYWDYAGYGQRREDKASVKERPTLFKKVLFRSYLDSSFTTPDTRGEVDEHLGIMGPIIKAEVDETIYVVFRNLASRPYSLHANGVSYSKNMEGLIYDDNSPYWYKYDDEVQPNKTFTYIWTVNDKVGPSNGESDCRIWTYYSGVNPERDIHSGLIGPLLVCKKGTLAKTPIDTQEFMLLFMTFDENKSWYYDQNWEILKKTNRRATLDPNFNNNIKFHAINGIIYSLKGLRMYANQLVNWHLINMGSPKDFHSIHFHGQTFLMNAHHRQGVYPLLPGSFATLQMWPSKPGLWMLESEVGISQQRGMQTLFLVLDNECDHPLGLISGAVKDSQITASNSRGYWLPNLARLHNTGQYNAWSTIKPGDWIQVDFQRPVVISKIATQGAKQLFTPHYVLNYTIFYSTDRKRWSWYKGDSKTSRKTFEGNREAYGVKENIFFPPIISRYVRLYPSHSYNYPTVRMEFYGCELDGCSVPLGMQSGYINDHQITASSTASSWYSGSWHPWLARLDKQGSLNAWQAKSTDNHPWIQIEIKEVKKITGIVTQGAKWLKTEMFVTTYVLEYSDDGKKWNKYSDNEDYEIKTFMGNSDNNSHMKNYIYPPIFSRFIRIFPTKWQKAATMRIELLGCDFE
ncbi:coagulation factor V isoform X1 [Tachysurus vachellii]|uniref:coagulation factor V isoform X1 n=1 Tax=Tachysurus vachellii TaxID=175792 RepID=UPI00296AECD7|nr:coagulation factor V isoform X1 [Tachysurus vachellii]